MVGFACNSFDNADDFNPAAAVSSTIVMNNHNHNNGAEDSPQSSSPLQLTDYDVLCGRHKAAFNNPGNRRFRVTVSLSLDRFMLAISRKEKNIVIKSILKIVKANGGRFLEYKKNFGLTELATSKAHMKVGHAFRDMALASRNAVAESIGIRTKRTTTTTAANNNTQEQDPTFVVSIASSSANNNLDTTNHSSISNQSIEDPLDLLESIPAGEFNFDEAPVVAAVDQDTEMLQWLVGESNGLLQHEEPTAPQEQQGPVIASAAVPEALARDDPNLVNMRNSLRASIVMNNELLEWLIGESNDLVATGHLFETV